MNNYFLTFLFINLGFGVQFKRSFRFKRKINKCNLKEQGEASRGVVANVDYMSIYASDLVQAVRKSAGDKGAFMCYILKLIFDLLD